MTNLTTPSVLAFERRLDFSDAFFFQKNSQTDAPQTPVKLNQKSVRATISNRVKSNEKESEIAKSNLQTVDVAMLDHDKDTLIAKWSCKVLPFTGQPNVCNNPDYQAALEATVQGYLTEHGITALAQRYAYNIINARWLWRNRMGAEKIKITVKFDGSTLVFEEVKDLPLNQFDCQLPELKTLTGYLEKGFRGEAFVLLEITAEAIIGYGQEVYPSQELILDNTSDRKSKILYRTNQMTGLHSQKVGNAIRTIDTWYQDNAPFPIASEPYGAVTTRGTAFRQPKQKNDFYTLFDNWILNGKVPPIEQQHYVMSVLIRGGIFGASGKEAK